MKKIVILSLACAIFTTFHSYWVLGHNYIFSGEQIRRHEAVLNDEAAIPWVWRKLTVWIAEGLYQIIQSYGLTFLLLRFGLCFGVLFLLALYFKTLELTNDTAIIGIWIFQFVIMGGLYNSDLSFNSFLEVIIYLTGIILVIENRLLWFIPLTIVGVLNRETGLFLPVLLLLAYDEKKWRYFLISCIIGLGVLGIMVYYYFQQNLEVSNCFTGFWGMLKYNLSRIETYYFNWIILGLILFQIKKILKSRLGKFVLLFLLGWFIFHLFMGRLEEARLLWVPVALILPMVLYGDS